MAPKIYACKSAIDEWKQKTFLTQPGNLNEAPYSAEINRFCTYGDARSGIGVNSMELSINRAGENLLKGDVEDGNDEKSCYFG